MLIPYDDLLTKTCHLLEEAGTRPDHAQLAAEAICTASLRGTDSHGIRLLPHYLDVIKIGRVDPNAEFCFEQTSPSTGLLNAQHGIAHAAVATAMDHAITLAKEVGVGLVSVQNSNHCGAMAYYGLRAAKRDMIGLAFTNASPKLKVFNAKESFFGINPICITAPMEGEEPFCYDAAPTVMSNNKVKMYMERGESLPEGVAADKYGEMTTNPALMEMLLPLGGELGGYKGYAMAMVVDIFCSLLSGMPNGQDVSIMYPQDGGKITDKRYLGQFVGAIRIDLFEDVQVFKQRLKKTACKIRRLKDKGSSNKKVMIPGDPEKKVAKERFQKGIKITDELKSYF